MERIMKQMSTVSQKLNAAKISSNIRALKQELWGSVDSLASDSLASDYSLSLDSRYMMTDPSWRTYSLETGYSRDGAPPATAGYSLESTADVASAVSRLARSVSQLSLEMETAAGDDVSLPAETGAELSELGADGEEAADLVDGVVELRHDGANAVRRYESLEALQSARAEPPAPADSWPFEPRPDGDGAQGNGEVPGVGRAGNGEVTGPRPAAAGLPTQPTPADVRSTPTPTPADVRSTPTPTPADARSTPTPTPADARKTPTPTTGDARSTLTPTPGDAPLTPPPHPEPGATPTHADRSTPDRRSTPTPTPTPTSPGATAGRPSGSDLHHPHVIVLGLRTKRTPEREPRTVSFRLGGDAGHLLASCRVDGDCLPPESAVLIRETETRAGRPGAAAADGAIQTSLQLEIRGMEATPAPPRADWTRLQAAVSSAGAVRRGRAGLTGWLAV
ncbi:hypothetical protein FJT64_019532 [Amphibalanus amphitrite]|uniref:Uncharacterized protein n=1 Tax=Amphibalanus amphitrite TaxID=1232801 RepID=A0A6A4X4U0_AMPAM|nr:hypothetical protein FJT64_019532 [Amphibalanus amphitrite]